MKYEPPESGTRPMPMNAGTKLADSPAMTDVARAREREAGARGRAVDGGDHGLLEGADGEDVLVVARAQAVADVPRALLELRQVLADAEAAALAGDDDSAHRGVARLLERRLKRLVHGGVERVEHVRAVEREREHTTVASDLDLGHDVRA